MASRYIFTASARANVADESAYVGAASGGTITGASGTVELVFDDAVYGATREGRMQLIEQVEMILNRLKTTTVWPITSAS